MSDLVNIIPIPVVTVSIGEVAPVVEVSVDHTGPMGPSSGITDHTQLTSIGINPHDAIDEHIANGSNPHGDNLFQTNFEALKAVVGIINDGVISVSKVINFTQGGCYTCIVNNGAVLTFTVSSLGVGQRGSVHILAGASIPTISWVGVSVWIGGVPTYVANKLTVVTLFNDGTRIIGSFGNAS